MSGEILMAARKEAQRLQAELEQTAAYRRLQLVQRVIAEYGSPETDEGGAAKAVRPFPASPSYGRPGSQTSLIVGASVSYLRTKGQRATSGELLRHVEANGIKVGGKKPGSTLASYLSNSGFFDNVQEEGGYGLKEWAQGSVDPAPKMETPDSGELTSAPRSNGHLPLNC